ncbi:MAG: Histidinol dehydrogenase [uncultured Chloroflexi bacterium]|uniref:Histidinol dehydrogenase n=1 Tax=uncultured Chloroflexota bacterium TaxID=166587 RepID=A0A6J4KFE3_9CHLR|nr:MAG: Histidinol dehydrogenase [uncultured Chloroflexota bacterium]
MSTLRIVRAGTPEARQLLARVALTDIETGADVAELTRVVFGEPLSPEQFVERVHTEVRARGDAALREIAAKVGDAASGPFETSREEIEQAYRDTPPQLVDDLRRAADRVADFHAKQPRGSWIDYTEGLGQMRRPLERVGLYAPGGRAVYPSTVIMTAVPARVAGVEEIILSTPARDQGRQRPDVLVAADISGVHRVFKLGGAQAIVAMAYGTESVPRVDKVLGPGNLFVVLAKRRVFGAVAIDQLPGPTETMVLADESADPDGVAADLLAQAEHDPLASAILVTTSDALARSVQAAVERQLETLSTAATARVSLAGRGGAVVVRSVEEGLALANEYAPEHLCLLVRDAWTWVGRVRHAGGVFVGDSSPEAAGDYIAGPSHVMPTAQTARFSSVLSVDDFLKTISVVGLSRDRLREVGPIAARLARSEGFEAHARAVEVRLRDDRSPA